MRFRSQIILLFCLASGYAASASEPLKLNVGIYENAPKIFSDRDGKPAGLFVDLLNQIAQEERWKIQYVSCIWAECLESLRTGRLDLLPDVAYTEARAEIFSFPQVPALHSWSQVYQRKGTSVQGVLDLAEKRIAVRRR